MRHRRHEALLDALEKNSDGHTRLSRACRDALIDYAGKLSEEIILEVIGSGISGWDLELLINGKHHISVREALSFHKEGIRPHEVEAFLDIDRRRSPAEMAKLLARGITGELEAECNAIGANSYGQMEEVAELAEASHASVQVFRLRGFSADEMFAVLRSRCGASETEFVTAWRNMKDVPGMTIAKVVELMERLYDPETSYHSWYLRYSTCMSGIECSLTPGAAARVTQAHPVPLYTSEALRDSTWGRGFAAAIESLDQTSVAVVVNAIEATETSPSEALGVLKSLLYVAA